MKKKFLGVEGDKKVLEINRGELDVRNGRRRNRDGDFDDRNKNRGSSPNT